MLKQLQLTNVGPASSMEMTFGSRLNLLTGDNGLGKSFLLDIAWWVMTRRWPGELNSKLSTSKAALPTNKQQEASIQFAFESVTGEKAGTYTFDSDQQGWPIPPGRPAIPGLVFYALADGSFAVWDPMRNYWTSSEDGDSSRPGAFVFSPKEVWDGLQQADGNWLCNGLIRDWASWQKEKGAAFESLKAVLRELSSADSEVLAPGELTRISLEDVRDMPTLRMPYGQDVAVAHASSGMRRIIALAYFLVWCWQEHCAASKLRGKEPENKITFLIDEVESHLHPKWQRRIIPSLLNVTKSLTNAASTQLLVATHSPLIMASVEPHFDPQQDAWFDLDLAADRHEQQDVTLTARRFLPQGDASRWLTSEAFDLDSARSREAETAIQHAAQILSNEEVSPEQARELDARLRSLLGDTDPFWIRWRYIGEKKGWLPQEGQR